MSKTFQLASFLVLVSVCSVTMQPAQAQVSTTMYHMYGIPQANQLNPAFQPRCNSYLGLPMLSPLNFSLESKPLTYEDVFSYNEQLHQNITFMHPDGDKQTFRDALNPLNTIYSSLSSGPLSIGWRYKDFYFTFDVKERIETSVDIPEDLAEFVLYGNQNQNIFNFSDLKMDASAFNEFAFGISYNFEDQFQVGARAKILSGLANLNTRSSDIILRANEDRWEIASDILLDITGPELIVPVDSAGFVILDSINTDFSPGENNMAAFMMDNLGTFLGVGNTGFGIDLGFNFFPIEDLSVSASINDLGFIRWKNNAYQWNQDGSFAWEGVEVTLEEGQDPGDELLDSLKNQLLFRSVQEPYSTFLSGKVYLGVAYELNDMVRFGLVNRTRIYKNHFFNQFTVSANVMPIRMLSASVSYSIIGNNYTNFGLGLSLFLGPLNLYFITDQIASGYLLPEKFNSVNFRFGMNLAFGCTGIPRKLRDRPIID